MTGLWMLTAVVCAAEAIWLKQWRPVRVPSDLAPAERMRELPLPLILEMLSVAIRQGLPWEILRQENSARDCGRPESN